MNKVISSIFFGRGNALSGAIAFGIVALIALGCTCGKNFDLSNLGKDNSNSTRSSSNIFDDKGKNTGDTKTRSTGQKPDPQKDGLIPPSDDQLQALVKETMLDFNDAVKEGNFDNFYSKISKVWQKQTSSDQIKNGFQEFIDGRANLDAIEDMDATFSTRKVSTQSGYKVLDVAGEYATSPSPSTFDLEYIAEGHDWKLFKIQVYTTVYKH
jgi:hypothetical protein